MKERAVDMDDCQSAVDAQHLMTVESREERKSERAREGE